MNRQRGDLAAALRHADAAVQSRPRWADGWALRGDVLAEAGRIEEALENYHRALRFAPGDTRVRLEVAEIHRRLGQPHRALVTLERLAQQFEPGQEPPHILYLEALALQAIGRPEDALEQITIALRRGPPTPELMYQLAELEWTVGDLQSARHAALEANRLGADQKATRVLMARIDASERRASGATRR